MRIRDPRSCWLWIREGKIQIRDRHSGSATLVYCIKTSSELLKAKHMTSWLDIAVGLLALLVKKNKFKVTIFGNKTYRLAFFAWGSVDVFRRCVGKVHVLHVVFMYGTAVLWGEFLSNHWTMKKNRGDSLLNKDRNKKNYRTTKKWSL